MNKVKILKNINIAFDGINTKRFVKGDVVEVNDQELSRLIHYSVVELPNKNEPQEIKIIEPENKEKPKKGKKAKK